MKKSRSNLDKIGFWFEDLDLDRTQIQWTAAVACSFFDCTALIESQFDDLQMLHICGKFESSHQLLNHPF